MTPEQALLWSLGLPLAGAFLVALVGKLPNLRDATTVAISAATFWAVLKVLPAVRSAAEPEAVLFSVWKGWDLAFRAEPLGMIFAIVASGLWILTSIYAFGYMRAHKETGQTRFFVCFAIAIFAAIGIAFARNLFTLFLFYEVLTFSTYPLVTHHRTEQAMRSGRTYLGILVTTSIAFLLLAIALTWQWAGTLEFSAGGILRDAVEAGELSPAAVTLLLALYAFGIGKAALMPFHRWLPAAMVAPTPVSALLHAVAVVKAGVFTVMKVVVYVFGVGTLAEVGSGSFLGGRFLVWVACFTILAASLVALGQQNLKRRLAYSTISQLSYIVLGAALATSASVLGGALHIVTHAVGKITLFFCAGAIYVKAHKTEIPDMQGLGRRMPFTMGAFLVASLSIVGVPPLAGSWSKWFLVEGALSSDRLLVVVVLMVSSLLNILYLLPIAVRAFFLPPDTDKEHGHHGHGGHEGFAEAPPMVTVPLVITALLCVALFVYPDPFIELARLLPGVDGLAASTTGVAGGAP